MDETNISRSLEIICLPCLTIISWPNSIANALEPKILIKLFVIFSKIQKSMNFRILFFSAEHVSDRGASILSKNQTIDAGFTSGGGMENTFLKSDGTSIINPYFNEDYISLYKNSEENIENYIKAEYNTTSKEIYKGFLKKIIEYGDSKGNTYPRGYPDVALSSTNYLIYMTDNKLTSYLVSQEGTSASSPLMASIYAVISSNLDIPETYYGQLNSQLFDAYNNDIWRKKVFNPVCSYDNTTDNSGVINVNGTIQTLDAGWGIAQNRLSTANKNSSEYGYGFDFIVGLGSINATELQNYIESTISSNKNYISSININNNNLVIYYN